MGKNKGWVKLWREQFGHEISDRKPWCDGYAWSYLYARANYKAGIVNFRNQYIPIERGQFITSKLKLQETFGWSKRRTNSFLISLEVRGMCTIRVDKRFTIITICNYEKYQSTEDKNEQTDVVSDVPTDGQQMATNKKYKEKNESTYTCPHQSIVDIYHNELPGLPPVKIWSEERKKSLRARWVEDPKRQNLDWWKRYFEYVRDSSFLMGDGKEKWQANLEWLVQKKNLINVIEGKYHEKS